MIGALAFVFGLYIAFRIACKLIATIVYACAKMTKQEVPAWITVRGQ